MVLEFVDGWNIVAVLGEGAFGDVKLLECPEAHTFVAMKCVDTKKHKNAKEDIRKEIAVQRSLDHPNVLKLIGHRTVETIEYIFLEYAPNGELFDRIEPDVGMAEANAHRFFHHLMSGLDYLHIQGVAHRDIKPENLLLGVDDVLKISDFGLATIFRYHGKERILDRRCGTMPYVAPEVLLGRYRGDEVDIWSSGIVLAAMLSGELPWDSASPGVQEFVAWERECAKLGPSATQSKIGPWSRLSPGPLALLRGILCPNSKKRFKMADIITNEWYKTPPVDAVDHVDALQPPSDVNSPAKKKRRTSLESEPRRDSHRLACSQPAVSSYHLSSSFTWSPSFKDLQDARVTSTQPENPDCMWLDSQQCATQATQATQSGQSYFHRMVKRMTRFVVGRGTSEALILLQSILEENKLKYKVAKSRFHQHQDCAVVSGMDKRNMPLDFRVTVHTKPQEVENDENCDVSVLLDFRLSKGDGLEFKRLFVRIKKAFADRAGPISSAVAWSD